MIILSWEGRKTDMRSDNRTFLVIEGLVILSMMVIILALVCSCGPPSGKKLWDITGRTETFCLTADRVPLLLVMTSKDMTDSYQANSAARETIKFYTISEWIALSPSEQTQAIQSAGVTLYNDFGRITTVQTSIVRTGAGALIEF
jgi:hypothetical protein